MATNRAVKGYIFKEHPSGGGGYYLDFGEGITPDKEEAYVFTMYEVTRRAHRRMGWGGKQDGTWIVVYE